MIRMSRLADYGVIVMTHIANRADVLLSGPEIAADLKLPAPTVSKVLKSLGQAGLLSSYRGVKGGYTLALAPEEVSVADIIAAVEGPIALTECIDDAPGACGIESFCPTRRNWRIINDVVRDALSKVSLAEMMSPFPALFAKNAVAERGRPLA